MIKKDLLEGLSNEQIEKINRCKSNEEILDLAKKEGVELTSEQLDAVNGGACEPDDNINNPGECPKCESTNTKFAGEHDAGRIAWNSYECLNCKHEYKVVKCRY